MHPQDRELSHADNIKDILLRRTFSGGDQRACEHGQSHCLDVVFKLLDWWICYLLKDYKIGTVWRCFKWVQTGT